MALPKSRPALHQALSNKQEDRPSHSAPHKLGTTSFTGTGLFPHVWDSWGHPRTLILPFTRKKTPPSLDTQCVIPTVKGKPPHSGEKHNAQFWSRLKKNQIAMLETFSGMEPPSSENAACRLLPTETPKLPLTQLREKILPVPPAWHGGYSMDTPRRCP